MGMETQVGSTKLHKFKFPGTPGWSSYWGGPRITYDQAQQVLYISFLTHTKASNEFGDALPTIPVQPLGYGDAYPLLSLLQ